MDAMKKELPNTKICSVKDCGQIINGRPGGKCWVCETKNNEKEKTVAIRPLFEGHILGGVKL